MLNLEQDREAEPRFIGATGGGAGAARGGFGGGMQGGFNQGFGGGAPGGGAGGRQIYVANVCHLDRSLRGSLMLTLL